MAPRAHRGRHRRDQGAVRVRLRRLPPGAPHRADRLRLPGLGVAAQGGRAGRPRPAAAPRPHQRLTPRRHAPRRAPLPNRPVAPPGLPTGGYSPSRRIQRLGVQMTQPSRTEDEEHHAGRAAGAPGNAGAAGAAAGDRGDAGPEGAPPLVPAHPAGCVRRGALRLPGVHPVPAAAQRADPGRGLRDHRRDRLRRRRGRGLRLARVRRPGRAAGPVARRGGSSRSSRSSRWSPRTCSASAGSAEIRDLMGVAGEQPGSPCCWCRWSRPRVRRPGRAGPRRCARLYRWLARLLGPLDRAARRPRRRLGRRRRR